MLKQLSLAVTSLALSTAVQLADACPLAAPTDSASFCASFKQSAQCHCQSHGLPAALCTDVSIIYQRMLAVYGSLSKACHYQTYTSVQDCIDSWNCYRLGGTTSSNTMCSGTGAACA